jgi:DNA-binding transcriptional ArsR family regulator
MSRSAAEAASFLKSLSHEQRLMILCHLCSGEKSVGELMEHLGLRQAATSQMLARLREDGLVQNRMRRFRPIDLGRFCRVTSLPEDLWTETEIFHGGCRG